MIYEDEKDSYGHIAPLKDDFAGDPFRASLRFDNGAWGAIKTIWNKTIVSKYILTQNCCKSGTASLIENIRFPYENKIYEG